MIGLRKGRKLIDAQIANAPVRAAAAVAAAAPCASYPAEVAPEADAAPRASTDLADPWHGFINNFNEIATASPSGVSTASSSGASTLLHTDLLTGSVTTTMPSASASAIQAAREVRERRTRERTEQVAAAYARVKRQADERARVTNQELFPLTGLPVVDGKTYTGHDYQLQLDIAARDEFLTVLEMPPLYEPYSARFAMADASVRQQLKSLGEGRPFKFGITRGPAVRFHNRPGSGIGPRGGFKGYFEEGYDGMVVLFCGPPNHCAELEKRLIATYKPTRACQNSADGGEGKAADGVPSFLYMSWAKLGQFADLETKARFRNSAMISRSRNCLCQAHDAQGV